jgi:hypothetical protein
MPTGQPSISVLIPARNEEASIRASVESALASEGVNVEVIVLDDHSTDKTGQIVLAMAMKDSRVSVEASPPLPPGWCGKQHACAALAKLANHPLLVFMDADVRLESRGLERMAGFVEKHRVSLVSGIPRQETGTWLEQLLIPLIHFLLLGFLPIDRMRKSKDPFCGAGCGQLMMVRREAYFKMGGHVSIRESLHDGIKLPRAFRYAGFTTDLMDATDIATCRMYRNAGEVWRGLTKNATEGLGSPAIIVPATVALFFGQVAPLVLLVLGAYNLVSELAMHFALVGTVAAYLPRLIALRPFRQSFVGAVFHPLGVLILLVIQWHAFTRMVLGRPSDWKGRIYTPAAARS